MYKYQNSSKVVIFNWWNNTNILDIEYFFKDPKVQMTITNFIKWIFTNL